MNADDYDIDAFQSHAPLTADDRLGRFEIGVDRRTGDDIIVQSISSSDPWAPLLAPAARDVAGTGAPGVATLAGTGDRHGRAFAAYRVARGGRTLQSLLHDDSLLPPLTTRLRILCHVVRAMRCVRDAGAAPLRPAPSNIWLAGDGGVEIAGVIAAPLDTRALRDELESRYVAQLFDLLVGTAHGVGGAQEGPAQRLAAQLAALLPRDPGREPLDFAKFESALAEGLAGMDDERKAPAPVLPSPSPAPAAAAPLPPQRSPSSTPGRSSPRPAPEPTPPPDPMRRETPQPTSGPLPRVTPASPPDDFLEPIPPFLRRQPDPDPPSPVFDENVQFTVYRPRLLSTTKWLPLLAFAHLSERRADAADDEPDPTAEVSRQAAAVLGDVSAFRQSIEDSGQAIPRDGEITFVPTVAGADFNPRSCTFRWTESVHRADFRVRASSSTTASTLKGKMAVYLGAILLAEINLSFTVGRESERTQPVPASARPYRRIFASYSHKDHAIVRQCWDYAKAMGDRYLQDVLDLRSGEKWAPALEQLIRDADVFQLFWSWNSLESPYVQSEWRFALSLDRPSFIRPVYWDDPLPQRGDIPPQQLLDLHFQQIGSWRTDAGERDRAVVVGEASPSAGSAPGNVPTPGMPAPSAEAGAAGTGAWPDDTARPTASAAEAPPVGAPPAASAPSRKAPTSGSAARSSTFKRNLLSLAAVVVLVGLSLPTLLRTTPWLQTTPPEGQNASAEAPAGSSSTTGGGPPEPTPTTPVSMPPAIPAPPASLPAPTPTPPVVAPKPTTAPALPVEPNALPSSASSSQAAAVAPPDNAATTQIAALVGDYCRALESLQARNVERLYPRVNADALQSQFRQYAALECTAADITVGDLDARERSASVSFEMRQRIHLRDDGGERETRMIGRMRVNRTGSGWRIEEFSATPLR